MPDVNCPYCGAEQDICHDDGYGYEEDHIHQQTCGKCEKTFVFTTLISFYYEVEKADCLNGSEHDMRPVVHVPRYYPNWVRCTTCGLDVRGKIDRSAMDV